MKEITSEQLKRIMPTAKLGNINEYLPFMNVLMPEFGIDTGLRRAHFVSQIAHESGCLQYVKEIASGEAYEGRKDLGNINPGDGKRYKGRGLIQLTGRANYELFNKFIDGTPDVIENPEQIEEPRLAVMVSCWFWQRNNINRLADRDDIRAVTRRINGGLNGLNDRMKYLELAKKVLL